MTPISTATNTPGPPITVGSDPVFIAITPNSKTAYVATDGSVIPITIATNKAGPPITTQPAVFIAITPDGKTAYVANHGATATITPIATATNTASPPIPVGHLPLFIAITPVAVTRETHGPIVSDYRVATCVAYKGDPAKDGSTVVIAHCNGSPGQNWTIGSDETIRIDGDCLDTYHDETRNGAPVDLHRQRHPAMAGTQRRPRQP
ncbi:MAG TPA: ricin-type beta-trefoil lectin domain protein, partial [Streptosporangiaceae bacterium]